MRRRTLATLGTALVPVLTAGPALAAPPLAVDTSSDTVDVSPGDGACADAGGRCSLRAAVQEANAGKADVITLAAGGRYPLRIAGAGEDAAATGDLDVSSRIRVVGNGAVVAAEGLDRAFDVLAGGRLRAEQLNVTSGAPPSGESGGAYRSVGRLVLEGGSIARSVAAGTGASGGGIANLGGTLRAEDVTINDNRATRAGGGIEANAGVTRLTRVVLRSNTAGPTPGNGGGLHLTGAGIVSFDDGLAEGNTATAEGGGLWNSSTGRMRIAGSVISGNTASGDLSDQGGGGLFNDGDTTSGGKLTVRDSFVDDNSAPGLAGSGGGILNDEGTLVVRQTSIAGNSSQRAGGGVEANVGDTRLVDTDLRSNSTGAAPGNGGGLHLTGAGTVLFRGGTASGNTAAAEGGGLWNSASGTMRVRAATIAGNTASGAAADQGGGGLFTDGGGLTVENTTVSGNTADGAAGSGGGILNNLGTLSVRRSSVVKNTSRRAGGGIEANGGTTSLERVLLDDNRTGSAPGNGGGLHLTGAGTVTIDASRVLGNAAGNEGGGLWNSSPGTMIVTDTVIRNNTAVVIGNEGDGQQVFWQPPGTGTFTIDGAPVAAG